MCNGKGKTLNWSLNPIPSTSYSLKRPSTLNTPIQTWENHQKFMFSKKINLIVLIKSLYDLSEKIVYQISPVIKQRAASFHFSVLSSHFWWISSSVRIAIKIDSDLHDLNSGNLVPLPIWFRQGRNAKLTAEYTVYIYSLDPLFVLEFEKLSNCISIDWVVGG